MLYAVKKFYTIVLIQYFISSFSFSRSADLLAGSCDPAGRAVVPCGCLLSFGRTPSATPVLGHGNSRAVAEPERRGWGRDLAVLPAPSAQHERPSAGLSGVASGSGRPAQNQQPAHRALYVSLNTSDENEEPHDFIYTGTQKVKIVKCY